MNEGNLSISYGQDHCWGVHYRPYLKWGILVNMGRFPDMSVRVYAMLHYRMDLQTCSSGWAIMAESRYMPLVAATVFARDMDASTAAISPVRYR